MTAYASITSGVVQKHSSTNLTVEMATGFRITTLVFLAFSTAVAQNVTESKAEEFHVGVVLQE